MLHAYLVYLQRIPAIQSCCVMLARAEHVHRETSRVSNGNHALSAFYTYEYVPTCLLSYGFREG